MINFSSNSDIRDQSSNSNKHIDGIARCARYALGPNRLHLCGPDASREVLAYISENESDMGLANILEQFRTLYPYLKEISRANHIKDPFDPDVVEAYWLGNALLEKVSPRSYYRHLTDNIEISKKLDTKSREHLFQKIGKGARMHHSFHVFNIWQRTGNTDTEHTLESIDNCRVSWGKVLSIDGPSITVSRQPVVLKSRSLLLGEARKTKIQRRLEDQGIGCDIQTVDTISIHWGLPCEILNPVQIANLKKYTLASLALANRTV